MEENKIIERIIKKSQAKIAISKFIEGEKYMPKSTKILKTVATIVITLGIGTGLVYATGTVVSEKIWKEPKQYKINQNLTVLTCQILSFLKKFFAKFKSFIFSSSNPIFFK